MRSPTGKAGTDVLRGLRYPFDAIRFMRRHRLWSIAAVPLAVNIAVLALVFGVAVFWLIPKISCLVDWLASLSTWFYLQSLVVALGWLAMVVACLLVFVASALAVLVLGRAIASPFLDLLSEKVESIALGTPEMPLSLGYLGRSMLVAVGDLLRGTALLAVAHLVIALAGAIPGVGWALGGAASVFLGSLVLAHESIGMAAARRLVSYRRRWSVIWENRWLSLGFGLAVMALLAVPGLNLLLLPLATVGGTLAYCDLRRAGSC
ncbi:MAG: EI24 domain-containing protein [Pseudomonadota bacterium]